MSYLDLIRSCNRCLKVPYVRLLLQDEGIGFLRPEFAAAFESCCDWCERTGDTLRLQGAGLGVEALSGRLDAVVDRLIDKGVISHRHGERYGVYRNGLADLLLLVDRAAAPHFGIRAFGQHLNGYVRDGSRLLMWLGRRSDDRKHFPGALDNVAAGGLPHGISLDDNLAKECWEEAGIAADLVRGACPVGTVSYCCDTAKGRKLDTLYCYDLELPADFTPRCTDGEVQEFLLLPIEEVVRRVLAGDQFKLNSSLVVIDFLVRWGVIPDSHPDYAELTRGLHAPLPAP